MAMIPNRNEFDLRKQIKNKKIENKLNEIDKKGQLKTQQKENEIKKLELENQRLQDRINKSKNFSVNTKEYFANVVANVVADYLSNINFEKVDKNIVKLLENQNFTFIWRQALKIASKDKISGLLTYNSNFSKKPVVLAGSIQLLEMEDDTITRLIINCNEKYSVDKNFSHWEFTNIKGKVKYRRWTSKSSTFQVIENDDTKWNATTYTQIPVAIMPNNEEMTNDINIVKEIIELFEKAFKKSTEQIEMGGVKGFLERNLLAQGILKGTFNKDKAKQELEDEMKGNIVLFDLNNVSMNSLTPTNQPLIQIENLPFQLKDLRDFMQFNMDLIFKSIGIPQDKAKNSAQETDSQIANTNKLQNNSIQAKKLLREFTLKQMIVNLSMVMSNLKGTKQNEYSTELIENIEDVEVEIELEQDINDKMQEDEKENKNNIKIKKGELNNGQ